MELEESRRIVADKDKVLADAQRQAETLIDQAKDYIAKLTAESELVKSSARCKLIKLSMLRTNPLRVEIQLYSICWRRS